MYSVDKLYRDLQVHLDKQTIGFPATSSGSDIVLLKQMFTPAQAEVVMMLTYRFEPLVQIQERAKAAGKSVDQAEHFLDETAAKGLIGFRKRDGKKLYATLPYIVGMLEAAAFNATPEMISAITKYNEDGLIIRDFINTKIPQMRTIPVQKSITPKHHIGNYDEIRKIIESTDGPIVIAECVCRKNAEKRGEPCKQTSRKETCMAFHEVARNMLESKKMGRQISKEEALDIMRQNQEEGLVLQPTNSQTPEAVCSCCGCCCGLLKLHKFIPNPVSHWATNYFAEVNPDLCTECGLCEEKCQADAIKLDDEKKAPVVDRTRCLGCGLCVAACPAEALELRNKETETIPPFTREEMMEVIMANKPQATPSGT
jgi:Na+-translocating ferredoxin:NAD+ oxidoreductase subunit B